MLSRGLFLASAAYVAAQSGTSEEPCAAIASEVASGTRYLSAQLAFDCLDSVPVDVQGNSKLIDELKLVWQFQSELTWLKNPGSDWEYGPLDIEAELDKIKSNLGSYSSEYTVQLAIQNITVRTGNYHFNYMPDILQAFTFLRPVNVASISSDGKSLPKLYVYEDVELLRDRSDEVSEISELNGMNPYDYLKSTFFSQYIDSDGQMNKMFVKGDTLNSGVFRNQAKFDGNSTDFTWANRTEASLPNLAVTQLTFDGVTDGRSFFEAYCTGQISGADLSDASMKTGDTSPRILEPVPQIPAGSYHTRNKRQIPDSGYTDATAAVESRSGAVSGYFLNGNGYNAVAVLKIISFSNPSETMSDAAFLNDFQATISQFLAKCISASKQKLIIDLRENGGGETALLIDTFNQLFPEMEAFSAQRYRASDAWIKIGNAVNEIYSDQGLARKYARATGDTIQESNYFRYWSWWQFRTAKGARFSSWDEFNGPLSLNSDKLTATMRYNTSNTNEVSIRPNNFYFSNRTNTKAAFSSDNVVMYTDALCGSSCASFHEELKNIAGVKAVTVGGRPENRPIQTVTGTKGGEVIPLYLFPVYAGTMLNVSSTVGLASVSATDASLTSLASVPQVFTRVGDRRSRAQSQDQIRKGDKTATPLQFVYEASDCKIFYTAETFADPDAAWRQAYDAWQDDAKCVQGSTKHKSSISGGYKPYGPGELKDTDEPQGSGNGSGGSGGGSNPTTNAAPSTKISGLLVAAVAVGFSVLL